MKQLNTVVFWLKVVNRAGTLSESRFCQWSRWRPEHPGWDRRMNDLWKVDWQKSFQARGEQRPAGLEKIGRRVIGSEWTENAKEMLFIYHILLTVNSVCYKKEIKVSLHFLKHSANQEGLKPASADALGSTGHRFITGPNREEDNYSQFPINTYDQFGITN